MSSPSNLSPDPTPPLGEVALDHAYVAVRARLIEVAAFMDRMERYGVADDFRCHALTASAAILTDGQPERARRILEHLSDPTSTPAESASGKAACGAWNCLRPPTR